MRKYNILAWLLITLALAACVPPGASPTGPVPTQIPVQPSPVPPTVAPPTPTAEAALSEAQLKNATYQLDPSGQPVRLQDGKYEGGSGAAYLSVSLLPQMAFGDLNGDGLADAAVLLGVNTGGTGVFVNLVTLLNQDGQPVQAGTAFVDDRPQVNGLEIRAGQVVLHAIVHHGGNSMVQPTLAVTQTYQLAGSFLQLARLTSQTPPGGEHVIYIDRPLAGDVVSGVVQVQGSMPIGPFENNLAYRLYDAAGNLLDAQPFGVQAADMGAPATFNNPVSLPLLPEGSIVWLELAERSMADGTSLAAARVPLVVGAPATPAALQDSQPLTLTTVQLVDERNGWGLDAAAHILRTTDGGQAWTEVTQPGQPLDTFFLDAQTAWAYQAGDPTQGLLRTTDGGQTWASLAPTLPFDGYFFLKFSSVQDGWAEKYDVGAGNAWISLYETHDGGASWTQLQLTTPKGGSEPQPGVLHLCNICGDYFYYDDRRMLVIYGEGANDPAGKLQLSLSLDQGQTWQDQDLPFPGEQYSRGLVVPQEPVFFNDKDGVLPVGLITYAADGSHELDVSMVYTTQDGGLSWTPSATVVEQAGNPRFSMQFVTATDAFVPCGLGLCATHDGGQDWQSLGANLAFPYVSDSQPYVLRYDFVSPMVGWALTDLNGHSAWWKTSDGGTTWVEMKPVLLLSLPAPLPPGSGDILASDSGKSLDIGITSRVSMILNETDYPAANLEEQCVPEVVLGRVSNVPPVPAGYYVVRYEGVGLGQCTLRNGSFEVTINVVEHP